MLRTSRTLTTGLVALASLVAGCGGGGGGSGRGTSSGSAATSRAISIAGSYTCDFEGDPGSPITPFEFDADGSFTVHSFNRGGRPHGQMVRELTAACG
jgi:hypothetical protein